MIVGSWTIAGVLVICCFCCYVSVQSHVHFLAESRSVVSDGLKLVVHYYASWTCLQGFYCVIKPWGEICINIQININTKCKYKYK